MTKSKWTILILFTIAFIMLVIFFLSTSLFPYMGEDITDFSSGWTVKDNQSEAYPANIPGVISSAKLATPFTIERTLPNFERTKAIFFVSSFAQVTVSIDDDEIGSWGYDNQRYMFLGRRIIAINLQNEYAGKEIRITFTNYTTTSLRSIYFGDPIDIMAYAVSSDLPMLALGAFIFILGLILITVYMIDRTNMPNKYDSLWLGIFALLTAIYLLSDGYVVHMLLKPAQITFISVAMQCTIPASLLLFVLSMCKQTKLLIYIALGIHLFIYIPFSFIHLFNFNTDFPTYIVYQGLHILYCVLPAITIVFEMKAGNKKLKRLVWSLLILAGGLVLDTIKIELAIQPLMAVKGYFFKSALVVMIVIEVFSRLKQFVKDTTAMEADMKALSVKSELLVDNYKASQSHIEDIRQIKHDISAHFSAISQMISDNTVDQAKHYIDKLSENYHLDQPIMLCVHPLINAIINKAIKDAHEKNVHFTYDINVNETVTVEDYDICSVFTNLLDNAFEASSKCETPWITLACHIKNEFLCISLSNNYTAPIVKNNDRYLSGKRRGTSYGTGLEIVKRVVHNYRGLMDITYDTDRFNIKVTLKL